MLPIFALKRNILAPGCISKETFYCHDMCKGVKISKFRCCFWAKSNFWRLQEKRRKLKKLGLQQDLNPNPQDPVLPLEQRAQYMIWTLLQLNVQECNKNSNLALKEPTVHFRMRLWHGFESQKTGSLNTNGERSVKKTGACTEKARSCGSRPRVTSLDDVGRLLCHHDDGNVDVTYLINLINFLHDGN